MSRLREFGKLVIVLTGCETFGVKIAAEMLDTTRLPELVSLRWIQKLTWRRFLGVRLGFRRAASTEFVAIVRGRVDGLQTGNPTIVRVWNKTEKRPTWKELK